MTNREVVTFDRGETFRAVWRGRLCTPEWEQRGPAEAYLDMLERGQRQPEYVR